MQNSTRLSLALLLVCPVVNGCSKKKKKQEIAAVAATAIAPETIDAASKMTPEPDAGFTVVLTEKAQPGIHWLRGWSDTNGEILGTFDPKTGAALSANDVDEKNRARFLPGPTKARQISLESKDAPQVIELTGKSRNECGEVQVQLETSEMSGELFVTGSHPVQPRKVEAFEPGKKEQAALRKSVGDKAYKEGHEIALNDWRGYRADLDGDGTREVIIEATAVHSEDETVIFSVLTVDGKKSDLVGYIAGRDKEDDAQIAAPWGIGDLNGDGSMEVIVMHDEPWYHYHRLVAYQWTGTKLQNLTEFKWPERDCNADTDWPVTE